MTEPSNGKSAPLMFDQPHQTSPERALWQSVMLRAVEDALAAPCLGGKESNRQKAMREARVYLTTPSRDLAMICSLAGLEMAAVIDHMTRQIAALPQKVKLASLRVALAGSSKSPLITANRLSAPARRGS